MNILFFVITVLLVATTIIFYIQKNTEWRFSCAIALLFCMCGLTFRIIPTGYTGVKTTFGQISSQTLDSGFHVKIPFIQSINVVNNKQQDKKYEDIIWGEACDKTVVSASNIIVTYQINPEKSSYIYANVSNYRSNLIPQTLVNSAIKSAMVQLSSDDVTNRSKIEPLARVELEKAIKEKYGSDTILILKVTIDNMDFEDSYNKAIAEKQIARQQAEKQAIENQKAIDLAKAEQERANVDAETKKIKAQADADAMIISANAEAEAYRIKSSQITENLLKKWELDARNKHGWVTIQGANTIIKD